MKEDIEAIEDIFCGVVFIFIVAAIFLAILSIPARAQTIQEGSTFGALNPENIVRDNSHVVETIKVWDASKWENEIIAVPDTGNIVFYQDATSPLAWIRGDSLFIDDSTFVLLQRLNKPKFGWITDSIKWIPIYTTFVGGQHCQHDWVYGEPEMQGNRFGAYVFDKYTINVVCARGAHYANGKWDESPWHSLNEHCPYEERVREKICRKCSRGVIERDKWFQHFVAPPKREFEILKERQRNKQ